MRIKEIDEAEILTELPAIIEPIDFDIGDDEKNRAFAQALLKKKKETLEITAGSELFLTGNGIDGYIALYVKELGVLGYVIKYRARKTNLLGGAVTQVMLWRRKATPYVSGITKRIFFDVLLSRWPMVMSDARQTLDGVDFWLLRMKDASEGPYEIGLADFAHHQVSWWDHSIKFEDWIKNNHGWGHTFHFEDLRYVIKRK